MKNEEESLTGHRSSCCVYMYHHQRRPPPLFGRPLRYRPDARRGSTKPKRSLILLTHQLALFESHSHSIQITTPCIHINSIFICSYLHFHHSPIHHPSTHPTRLYRTATIQPEPCSTLLHTANDDCTYPFWIHGPRFGHRQSYSRLTHSQLFSFQLRLPVVGLHIFCFCLIASQ